MAPESHKHGAKVINIVPENHQTSRTLKHKISNVGAEILECVLATTTGRTGLLVVVVVLVVEGEIGGGGDDGCVAAAWSGA